MAKEASFKIGESEFVASLTKVDRDKVYGWAEERYQDKNGNPLTWATLLMDGSTFIATGGTALKTISPEGEEVVKSSLLAVLPDGSPAQIHKSVYDETVQLDSDHGKEDLMRLEVKSVYQLGISTGHEELKSILAKHPVLYFKFNYRADYEADDAFVIGQNGNIFIITGILQEFEYAYLEKPASIDNEETDADNSLDFNMF